MPLVWFGKDFFNPTTEDIRVTLPTSECHVRGAIRGPTGLKLLLQDTDGDGGMSVVYVLHGQCRIPPDAFDKLEAIARLGTSRLANRNGGRPFFGRRRVAHA